MGTKLLQHDALTDTGGTVLTSHAMSPVNLPGTVWKAPHNTIVIAPGGAGAISNAAGVGADSAIDSGVSDCIITVVAQLGTLLNTSSIRVNFRNGNPPSNTDVWDMITDSADGVLLQQTVGGVHTIYGQVFPSIDLLVHTYKIVLAGPSITVYRDGVFVTAANVTDSLIHNTFHGFGVGRSQADIVTDYQVSVATPLLGGGRDPEEDF